MATILRALYAVGNSLETLSRRGGLFAIVVGILFVAPYITDMDVASLLPPVLLSSLWLVTAVGLFSTELLSRMACRQSRPFSLTQLEIK